MEQQQEVGLGMKVQDVVSGFIGVVNHLSHYMGQAPMAALSGCSLDRDGKPISSDVMYELNQLKIIDPKPQFPIPDQLPPKFNNGDKVRDKLSGFEGKAGGRAVYVNGCSRTYVVPPHDPKAHVKIEGKFFADDRLELVEAAVQPKPATVSGSAPAEKPRGGPAEANSRL